MKTTLIFRSKTKRMLEGKEAYDAWHLYYYFKIFQKYYLNNKKFKKKIFYNHSNSEIDKYFLIINILKLINKKKIFITELGSSLLEIIEGLKYFIKKFKIRIKFSSFFFIGIESSNLFRFAGSLINKYKNFKQISNYKKLTKTDLIYDRAVSSYAFKSEKQLLNFFEKGKIVFTNLSVYKDPKNKNIFKSYNQFGNYKIFNIDKIINLSKFEIYYLYGKKKPNHSDIKYIRKAKSYSTLHRMDAFFLLSKDKKIIQKLKNRLGLRRKRYNFINVKNLNMKYFYKIKI